MSKEYFEQMRQAELADIEARLQFEAEQLAALQERNESLRKYWMMQDGPDFIS